MDDREKTPLEVLLTCPVCQDLFTEPRQLQCGHSICMSCLESMVGHSTDMPFRCPDCRAYFGKIVEVQKSYALANIVDDFKETLKQTVGPHEEEPRVVSCVVKVVVVCVVASLRLWLASHWL